MWKINLDLSTSRVVMFVLTAVRFGFLSSKREETRALFGIRSSFPLGGAFQVLAVRWFSVDGGGVPCDAQGNQEIKVLQGERKGNLHLHIQFLAP